MDNIEKLIVEELNSYECLHENNTAKEIENECFLIKCEDCGAEWVE